MPRLLLAPASLLAVFLLLFARPDASSPDAPSLDDPLEDKEVMIDERFEVAPGGLLDVTVPDADVLIDTWDRAEARVEVILEARNMDRARDYFKDLRFSVAQQGERIVVATDPPRRGMSLSWDRTGGAHITVAVHLPATFDAEVRTSDGDIQVAALDGRVTLRTSDGDITTATLRGPAVTLRTSDGDVRTGLLDAPMTEIQTSDGDITVARVRSDRVRLRTSDGDISAEHLEGDAEVISSDGALRLGTVRGRKIRLQTSDGDITTEMLVAESSEVSSSDGSLNLGEVAGALRATTSSGDIRVRLVKPAEVFLRTADGDVHVQVPAGYGAEVRLRGDRVRIERGLAFEGRVREEAAEGQLAGGGPRLEARTSDGTVSLVQQ